MAQDQEWVHKPEMSSEKIEAGTGHDWDAWVELIDAGPGREAPHPEIVGWVIEQHGIEGWWAQGVAIGYARIIGRRLPGQRSDGLFGVSKSRTVQREVDDLREQILRDADAGAFGDDLRATLRSRPGSKAQRFALEHASTGDSLGTAEFRLEPGEKGTKVVVEHTRIADPVAAEWLRTTWGAWIKSL